jgi:regulator of nucleoside diphosphate kinase
MAAMLPQHHERTLTELDHRRIERLVRYTLSGDTHPLDDILDAARIVPSRAVDPDVVTMYSRVVVADLRDGRRRDLALCYPDDTQPAAGYVSVLAPVGTGLLGLRVGDVAHWNGPFGRSGAARVLEIVFQPEANGDYAR